MMPFHEPSFKEMSAAAAQLASEEKDIQIRELLNRVGAVLAAIPQTPSNVIPFPQRKP
jgi:hypothetical protein